MKTLVQSIEETLERHKKAVKEDARYRRTFEYFEEFHRQQKDKDESGWHYDRNGYCDNPGRGY